MQKMEQLQMIEISTYSGSKSYLFADQTEARRFITNYAAEHNYGVFRTWVSGGKQHMDCGLVTFVCSEKIFKIGQ